MPMGTVRLTDLATGGLDREPDSWLIQNEDELLALVQSFTHRPPRVLVLDTTNHRVEFGVGDEEKESFAYIKDKRKSEYQFGWFPPRGRRWSTRPMNPKIVLAFASEGKSRMVLPEEMAPIEEVLRVVLWILQHDEVPEGVSWPLKDSEPPEADEDIPF
jgi:hypothetical protein